MKYTPLIVGISYATSMTMFALFLVGSPVISTSPGEVYDFGIVMGCLASWVPVAIAFYLAGKRDRKL